MKQRKITKQWLCLLLAALMTVCAGGIPMEAIAMTDASGRSVSSAVDLNGTWDFTPDTEAKAVVVRTDREQEAVPLAPLSGSETSAKLTVDAPSAVRYGKVMALIQVGAGAAAGQDGSLTLSAKVNGGDWHPLSLEGIPAGRKVWAELPFDPSDLQAGENTIALKSTAAAGQGAGDSVMLYGTDDEGGRNYCVRIKYYPELTAGWQDMTVPGAWEGNFTIAPEEESDPLGRRPVLCMTTNETAGQLIELEAYQGQDAAAIEIPVDMASLTKGANTFRFSTNVTAGPGQGNDTSVDIPFYTTMDGMDVTGSGFYENAAFVQATTNVPAVTLQLKKGDEWVDVKQYQEPKIGSVVTGIFADNGRTYQIQSALTVDDPSLYTEAKIVVTAHVGTSLKVTSDAESLLPENQFIPAMGVVINDTNAHLVDLKPYKGQSAASIEVPVALSSLQQGKNTFRVNTNIANGPGQRNQNTVDVLQNAPLAGIDITGSGAFENGNFSQAVNSLPAMALLLKKADGSWDEIKQFGDINIDSVVVGLLTDNGNTYEAQAALTIDDLSQYTEAKLVVSANVGSAIYPNAPADSLIPETVVPVQLKVAVNGGEETDYDVTSLLGTVSAATVDLDYSAIQTGDNVFVLNSNTVSHGQGQTNSTSMDIVMATPTTPTGSGTGFWSDAAFNPFQSTEAFHVTLLLQRADNDEWVEVCTHEKNNVNNLIIGKLGDNGVTYRPQVTPSRWTTPRPTRPPGCR